MKRLIASLVVLPLALAGCIVVPPFGPPPAATPTVAAAIIFAPSVQPYIYSVTQVSIYVYSVQYLPTRVTTAQILAAFGNRCAAQGRHPVAGQIRLVSRQNAAGVPVTNRVMTVYCQ